MENFAKCTKCHNAVPETELTYIMTGDILAKELKVQVRYAVPKLYKKLRIAHQPAVCIECRDGIKRCYWSKIKRAHAIKKATKKVPTTKEDDSSSMIQQQKLMDEFYDNAIASLEKTCDEVEKSVMNNYR